MTEAKKQHRSLEQKGAQWEREVKIRQPTLEPLGK